jgi:FkbM family methyltransferase
MVLRYQAFDVLLGVSMAEGCGLPLLEAQACGVPVIAGDWSAMGENVFAGWRVPIEESVPWPVSAYEACWRLPSIDAISVCLEQAYSTLQNSAERTLLSEHARTQVVEHHDQAYLAEAYWRPVLEELARRIEAERVPWHVHRWAGYGHPDTTGAITAPCLVSGCPAEKTMRQDVPPVVHPLGAPLSVGGIPLDIQDDPIGGVARAIAAECEHIYRLPDINLPQDAVIVDIGAHVGVVSCYLSKRFPQARILAFEPHPANFARLVRNLDANGCANVFCYPFGVTSDGRALLLNGDATLNTGSHGEWVKGPEQITAQSRSVDDIWQAERLGPIDLLKLDCEGAEYEILRALNGRLANVERLVMEVHENTALYQAHGLGATLVAEAQAQVLSVRASIIQIADFPSRDIRAGME